LLEQRSTPSKYGFANNRPTHPETSDVAELGDSR